MPNNRLTEIEEEPIEAEESPKKKRKGLLPIIIIAVIAIAGGIGAFIFFTKPGEERVAIEGTKKVEEGVMFAIDPFVVNLADHAGVRFLRTAIYLELADPTITEMARARTPQIRNAIVMILTVKTSADIILPEGKIQLKNEIKTAVNEILGENAVRYVFLTDFVMQ